jgi:peptidoglycan/LPS O-acetylase OafA/YrhL
LLGNGYLAVDTFFFISAFLVAYFSFMEMEKGRFNLMLFYMMRYIR